MKKTITTIAILLGLTIGATAQGGGMFQRGAMPDEAYYGNGYDRTTGSGLLLPNGHGDSGDTPASPLGSGIAVLAGLGAAYALKKRED